MQLIREVGGGACDVAKRRTYGKQRKAGRGTGNEATLYLRGVPQVAERISPSS